MVENSPDLEALKAEKAKAEAQRDLAGKQIEQLQAELALLKADPTGGPKAAAETQTAISNAQKAQADAAAAAVTAQEAAGKAKFGSVAGTQLGSTTADSGAGALEASLLAAAAIDTTASRIVKLLKSNDANARYILFTGLQRPSFGDYLLFQTRISAILEAYRRADSARNEADGLAADVEPEGPTVLKEAAGPIATAAGASLDLIAKLGSYFMSDYKFSSAIVSGVDADLLAVSLASRLTDCLYPARWSPAPNNNEIYGLLKPVTDIRDIAQQSLKQSNDGQRRASAAAADDEIKQKQLLELADHYQRASDLYTAANKAVDDLLASLSETDSTGIPRVTRIAEQKAISDKLTGGALALLVNVAGAGGTTYTKKNLWTFFGAAPFYVSGGAIASFLVVDTKGQVKAAGQQPVLSGYYKVREVADSLSRNTCI